ncbi:hypothetical protein VaNZ11_005477 [Volvox africanus]|uniref:Uncharacterized protein n=1 Tax=Volvox africanus TaxID=51714 RepID=A0ABQ5RYT2_9CHLO|nr:hypothetical protein VaNZ11_005477 [Volvox africanus]
MSEQLAVYRRCRRQYPGTAACVLLPAFCQRKAEASLKGMRRVHRFEPGTVLFNGVDREGMLAPWPGTSYSVDVWYEASDEGSVSVVPRFISRRCVGQCDATRRCADLMNA